MRGRRKQSVLQQWEERIRRWTLLLEITFSIQSGHLIKYSFLKAAFSFFIIFANRSSLSSWDRDLTSGTWWSTTRRSCWKGKSGTGRFYVCLNKWTFFLFKNSINGKFIQITNGFCLISSTLKVRCQFFSSHHSHIASRWRAHRWMSPFLLALL